MMTPTGIYVVSESQITYTAARDLLELQPGTDTFVTILRVWVSADVGASPADEVYGIDLYGNDVVATGGQALTEQPVNGTNNVSGVTALGGSTTLSIGASPTSLIPDGFHGANGWLYLPVPEERISFGAGGAIANVGLRITPAPVSVTISYGIVWAEFNPV